MARVPYFDFAKADGRLKEQLERFPTMNILKVLAHGGDLLEGFTTFGNTLINGTDLDPVLREIAIIRVGELSGAKYEMFQHRRIGRAIGMSEALLAGIGEGPGAAVFTLLQRQIMAFTDDIVRNVRASDATFDPLCKALGIKQTEELVILIGFYMMVSRFLETFDVEIEQEDEAPPVDRLPGVLRSAGPKVAGSTGSTVRDGAGSS